MLNHITIMGRMTRDPELRATQSGTSVASFTLAVERDYKDGGGERQADFIDVVAWRQTGEFVSKHFQKGSMAVVSGQLQIRDWTDKDGKKRKSAEVVAESVYFGESKRAQVARGLDELDEKHGKLDELKDSFPGSVNYDDGDGELPY